eukprot:5738001-Pleurochrysis_carterae.AAC.4
MSVSFKPVSRLRGHRAAVSCLEAGQPGSTFEHRLLSGGEDGISRLWDVQRGLSIRGFLPPGNDALGSICLGKGAVEHCIFVTKGKDIHVFDARIQEPVLRNVMGSLPGAEDDISMLGLHAAGTLLAAADDAGDIQVFDMVAGERQCVIEEAHESLCSAVAFRPGATDEIHSGGVPGRTYFQDNHHQLHCRALLRPALNPHQDVGPKHHHRHSRARLQSATFRGVFKLRFVVHAASQNGRLRPRPTRSSHRRWSILGTCIRSVTAWTAPPSRLHSETAPSSCAMLTQARAPPADRTNAQFGSQGNICGIF